MYHCSTVLLLFFSAGGVELLAKQGRIKVVNTLESRLEMMSRQVRKCPTGVVCHSFFQCNSNKFASVVGDSD